MAKTYNYTELTGGTDGCLDALTDAIVEDGDFALGVVSGVQYSHYFDADSATAASPPDVIEPISGSGRWLIAPAHSDLGFSEFAKTLIDDDSASEALTTLGFSAFAKDLIDDDSASEALTTLGIESDTWIPDLQFGGAKVGIKYSTQEGYYLKVGDWVSCTFRIVLTSKGTSTGTARIYGLPFTALSYAPVTVSFAKITYANQLIATLTPAAAYIELREITEGGSPTLITNTDFANDSVLNGSVFYKISS